MISRRVKNRFLVPEGHDLYKIIEVVPSLFNNQFVFKISIPLFRLEHFNIHQIFRFHRSIKMNSGELRVHMII